MAGGDADRRVPVARRFTAGGLQLHYLDWGAPNQPAIVFLHGGSAHAHWWDFVIPDLADRYRCVALDLRGHGDSAWPAERAYTLTDHAADVAALVDELGVDDAIVVGHSYGGFVAMVYAQQAGDRLRALAIVDSRVRVGERSARYMDALRKLPHPVYASLDEAVRRFRLLPTGSSAPPEVIAHMVRHGVVALPDGTWTLKFDRRAMASTPPQDFAPGVASLRCPLLAVRAEHSTILSAAGLEEFRRANPTIELAVIAGAHHHIMLDRPQALAAVLRRFADAACATR